jgi:hypothetical protein
VIGCAKLYYLSYIYMALSRLSIPPPTTCIKHVNREVIYRRWWESRIVATETETNLTLQRPKVRTPVFWIAVNCFGPGTAVLRTDSIHRAIRIPKSRAERLDVSVLVRGIREEELEQSE